MKKDFDIDKFLKEVKEKSEKNKDLARNNDFDSIPDDDDLCFAITELLNEKSDEELKTLPLSCQYVIAVYNVTNRAYAEDFEQVYIDLRQFVQLAIDGLFQIGEPELGDVLIQSYCVYKNAESIIDKYKQGIISWGELLAMKLWMKVHEDFYRVHVPPNITKNIGKYIRENYRDFVI